MIIGQIINIIYTIAILIAVVWIIVGIPLGIIFGILAITNSDQIQKAKFKKIALISLAGLPILILVFLVYFLLNLVLSLLGVTMSSYSIPLIK